MEMADERKSGEEEAEAIDSDPGAKRNLSYDVVTIVKKKIVFAKRPVPIVPTSMKS